MVQLNNPIFLNVEFSKSFVKEYKICATEKNVVMPYPTTDPNVYNGQLLNQNIERDKLLYYQGGGHGSCLQIRHMLNIIMKDKSLTPKAGMNKRENGFLQAIFCPIPIGDSPSSKRQYDVMIFGCIPVVLSDDLVWAFEELTGGPLKESNFSIRFPQNVKT